jgi:hypothetical protein
MERLVDSDSRATLFRHPSLRGIPDLVVEGDGYTLEFNCSAEAKGYGFTLLCLCISDPAGMARMLANPVKSQLPVGI